MVRNRPRNITANPWCFNYLTQLVKTICGLRNCLNFAREGVGSRYTPQPSLYGFTFFMTKPVPPDNQPAKNAVQMLEVSEHQEGQRLDNFLLNRLKGVPKTLIYRIIRKGEVRINSKRAKPESKLQIKDVVRVPPLRLPTPEDKGRPGEQLEKRLLESILFED